MRNAKNSYDGQHLSNADRRHGGAVNWRHKGLTL